VALLGVKRQTRPAIVALGLFGAALIYGDGAITPAISVLSALEGLTIAAPGLGPYVVSMAVAILVMLFAVQSQGTARIAHAFGPVMAAWFVAIAVLGVWGITKHPAVLLGLDPRYAISYLAHDGFKAFAVLGGVFLCVTGAEALYADMGHFGATPIRVAWSAIVFPSLVLNYAGQAAIVLADGVTADNIFYRLCPAPLLMPMIVLATVATVIASQSIITGAFSMTRQAIQLGWFPRLNITQTSAEGYGQIYVGPVNWLLMVVTIALTVGFGKSDNLAAAYGIAVSATISAPAGAAQGARLHHRSRRRDLLCGTRDGDPAPGRRGPATLAGGAVRLHGAQRLPCDGLFQPAGRSGCRNRPPDRDLRDPLVPMLRGSPKLLGVALVIASSAAERRALLPKENVVEISSVFFCRLKWAREQSRTQEVCFRSADTDLQCFLTASCGKHGALEPAWNYSVFRSPAIGG
jgi:hypothetical protein